MSGDQIEVYKTTKDMGGVDSLPGVVMEADTIVALETLNRHMDVQVH